MFCAACLINAGDDLGLNRICQKRCALQLSMKHWRLFLGPPCAMISKATVWSQLCWFLQEMIGWGIWQSLPVCVSNCFASLWALVGLLCTLSTVNRRKYSRLFLYRCLILLSSGWEWRLTYRDNSRKWSALFASKQPFVQLHLDTIWSQWRGHCFHWPAVESGQTRAVQMWSILFNQE